MDAASTITTVKDKLSDIDSGSVNNGDHHTCTSKPGQGIMDGVKGKQPENPAVGTDLALNLCTQPADADEAADGKLPNEGDACINGMNVGDENIHNAEDNQQDIIHVPVDKETTSVLHRYNNHVSCDSRHGSTSECGNSATDAEVCPEQDQHGGEQEQTSGGTSTEVASWTETGTSIDQCCTNKHHKNERCKLYVSLLQLEKCDGFRKAANRPAVSIDLCQPALVPVCTLYSYAADTIASGSSSMNSGSVVSRPQRLQVAVRGRRRNAANGRRRPVENEKQSLVKIPQPSISSESSQNRASLKPCAANPAVTNVSATVPEIRSSRIADAVKRRRRRTGGGRDSSDEENMTVKTVNRTYARYSYPSQPLSSPTCFADQTIGTQLETVDHSTISQHNSVHDDEKVSVALGGSEKSSCKREDKVIIVPSKRRRIGPAWYSRLLLNKPPSHLRAPHRLLTAFRTVKRRNYVDGIRRRPLTKKSVHLTTKQQMLMIASCEKPELENVGCESLVLWRMSTADIEELNSQLQHEAEHRRIDHAMPAVMQLSDEQIESAYEHVAQSMNTFEIVAVDSDEESISESDVKEEVNDGTDSDIVDEYHRMVAEQEEKDEKTSRVQSEYCRSRPKRVAVDYGPSAFASIMLMEGRRLYKAKKRDHGVDERGYSSLFGNGVPHNLPNLKFSSKSKKAPTETKSPTETKRQSNRRKVKAQRRSSSKAEEIVKPDNKTEVANVVSENEECLSSDDGDCVGKNVLDDERSSNNALQSKSVASSTEAPELLAPSGVFESSPTSTPPDLGLPIDK